ncbi:MAG: hypothetical protein KGY76_09870 [Candidatus Thermoplasmatota archaeon]|nr:hypothetical protein [Candidatus Thermoplasmatota archaeon]
MKILGARIEEPESAKEIFKEVENYREEKDTFIQLFDVEKVVGREHLLWALQKAEECFENGENRADSLEMETLLWSSAEWQIKDALDKMGIEDGAKKAVVMIDGDEEKFLEYMGWNRDDDLLEASEDKLKNFGVEEKLISTTEKPYDLVFEKMATSIL